MNMLTTVKDAWCLGDLKSKSFELIGGMDSSSFSKMCILVKYNYD